MSPCDQQCKGTIMLVSLQASLTGWMLCSATCLCNSPGCQGGGGKIVARAGVSHAQRAARGSLGGGSGRGVVLRQEVITQLVLFAESFRAKVLMGLDAGGIADEQFSEVARAGQQSMLFCYGRWLLLTKGLFNTMSFACF